MNLLVERWLGKKLRIPTSDCLRVAVVLVGLLIAGGLWEAVQTAAAQPVSQDAQFEAPPSEEPLGYAPHQSYTPEDYGHSFSGQNWSVTQDDRGVIYAANPSGVLIYDGSDWELQPTERETLVRTVVSDSAGNVFVGAYGEIGQIQRDSLGRYQYQSLLDHIDSEQRNFGHTWHGAATSDAVYFQSQDWLFAWDGEEMTTWSASDTTSFGKVFAVEDTPYVMKQNKGLLRLADGQWEMVPGGERFADGGVYALMPHEEGLLAGTHLNELVVLDGDSARPFDVEAASFLADADIYDGLQLPDGTYAIATLRSGVLHMDSDGSTLAIWDADAGLPSTDIKQLSLDREHGLWMATEQGLARVDIMSDVTHFDERAGLDEVGMSIARFDGQIHLGTNAGVRRLEKRTGGSNRAQMTSVSELQAQVFDLLSTDRGLLAATETGVFRVTDGESTPVQDRASALALHQSADEPDRVYVGYEDGIGILRWDETGRVWEEETRLSEFNEEIFYLEQDTQGRLWAASAHGGLWYVEAHEDFQADLTVHQIASEGEAPRHIYRMATVDDELRIITRDGIARPSRDADAVRLVPDEAFETALPEDAGEVLDLAAAPDGDVWVFTEESTYWLRNSGTDYLTDRPFAHLPAFSAMAVQAEAEGQLWVAGERALMRHYPRQLDLTQTPKHALLQRVTTTEEGDSLLASNVTRAGERHAEPALHLSPDNNSIRFDYTVPTSVGSNGIEYRYRLAGFEDEWSGWSSDSQKEYTNLPPGTYEFEVQARNDGAWHSEPAAIAFEILTPWYQTVWAYILFGLLAVGVVFGVVRWRSAHLRARARKLEDMVAQRTSEVQKQARKLETYNRELRQTNEALQKALEKKSELLGIAAHDLKNPIFGVRSLSELLLEKDELNENQREKIQLIHDSAVEMLDLINDLLESAAAGSGRVDLDMEVLDMTSLAEWVVRSFHQQANKKNQQLNLETPAQEALVEADKKRLREAMNNLVSNAIKYTPQGGTIDVEVTKVEEEAHFIVSDTGPGLRGEEQKKVFAPFQRLSPEPTAGEASSGLGLYIVKQLVDLHDGRVWVESTPGEGSTFTIALDSTTARGDGAAPDDGREMAEVSR